MIKIYTRTGDKGQTGLYGGKRISKASLRIHAYGSIDELNAVLGTILTLRKLPKELQQQLHMIQSLLFLVGADLATPLDASANVPRIKENHVKQIEAWIDGWEEVLPALKTFILPNGSEVGAKLHQARTICRRAERWMVDLSDQEKINEQLMICINRLGDYLFVAARTANKHEGKTEIPVDIRDQSTQKTQSSSTRKTQTRK